MHSTGSLLTLSTAVKSTEIISKNAEKSTVGPLHIKHCHSHVYVKDIGIKCFFLYKFFKCDSAANSSLPKTIKQVDFSLILLIRFTFC